MSQLGVQMACGLMLALCVSAGRFEPEVYLSMGRRFAGGFLVDINSAESYVFSSKAGVDDVHVYDPEKSKGAADAHKPIATDFPLPINRPDTKAVGNVFVDDVEVYSRSGRAALVVVDKVAGALDHAGDFEGRTSGRVGFNTNVKGESNVTDLLFQGRKKNIGYKIYNDGKNQESTLTLGGCDKWSIIQTVSLSLLPHPQNWWQVQADAISVGNFTAGHAQSAIFSTTLPNIALPKILYNVLVKGLTLTPGEFGLELNCKDVAKIPQVTFVFAGHEFVMQPRSAIEKVGKAQCVLRVVPSADGNVILGLPFYEVAGTCWEMEKKIVTLDWSTYSSLQLRPSRHMKGVQDVDGVLRITA